MEKVGILTFHFPENRNYGAALQSYACQKMIEKLNKNVYLIDYNPFKLSKIGKIIYKINGKNFREYSDKFLKKTEKCETFEDIKKLNKKLDIFVVGSDQVWRAKYTMPKTSIYYFDFVHKRKKKIAYGASFGVDFWEGSEELTNEIKALVQRFDYVSVREESGIKICNEILDIKAKCVLDPTLMIDKKDYNIILKEWKDKSHLEKKYIAHMLLDDTKKLREESKNIGKYLKANINYIKGKERKIFGKKIIFYNKVSQWLTYLKDSELVITDSFHCVVFSLIFNKQFIVVANSERGTSRLENLLEIVELKDRYFTNIDEVLKSGILEKKINYENVQEKLFLAKKYSLEFLKKALGEDNE